MGWYYENREITKEDYENIKAGKKRAYDFFSIAETAGYGAIPHEPYEKDGKYFIPYGISNFCD